jgi:ferredoxin
MEETSAPITQVTVDRDMCFSAASCLAYSIYELDDEAKAVILTKNGLNSDDPINELAENGTVAVESLRLTEDYTPEALQAMLLESAQSCPFGAIILHDSAGKQVWPPVAAALSE